METTRCSRRTVSAQHSFALKTGGVKGGPGLWRILPPPSSCHQIGPITLPARLKAGEEVFDVSTSLVFKEQKVGAFLRRKRNAPDHRLITGWWMVRTECGQCRSPSCLGFETAPLSRDDGHHLL